jgi:signal transduction histidine kinase
MGLERLGSGFVVVCDAQGTILEVLRDELHVTEGALGRPFTLLVERDCLSKALSFLIEIKVQGAALGWELNLLLAERVETLHFAGARMDEDRLLILAAKTDGELARLYVELVSIGNQQANALRAALKDLDAAARRSADPTTSVLYDGISSLNNQLVDMQRELARKNAELARLNQEKNRFLGIAAHDLRNPLQIIGTYSEFLLQGVAGEINPEQAEFLQIILDSSAFMAQLVDDLLDVAQIEAGELRLAREPTDLAALVGRATALNGVLARKKDITLHLQAEAVPEMSVDRAKIEQVLNNLLSNAVKYSNPGSRVDVRVSRQDGGALIAVRDCGPGIPAQDLERLFRPFQVAGVRVTGGEKSTGLGLAIVKRIVEGHGGRIWVESEVGRGTTFYVALPITPVGEEG